MTVNDRQEQDISQLLENLVEDGLNAGEHEQLSELLRQSDESLASYVDFLHLHASLHWELAESSDDAATQKPVWIADDVERAFGELNSICENAGLPQKGDTTRRAETTRIRRTIHPSRSFTVTATLLLAVTAVLAFVWPQSNDGDSPNVPISDNAVDEGLSDSKPLAVLANYSAASWDNGEAHHRGEALEAGVVNLSSGIAQVDFLSGATVVIEGPAELQLISDMRCNLRHGKLHAHVPPPARGFTVETSDFDVVDLGTEFAMQFSGSGLPEVHVIDGEVELRANTAAEPPLPLRGGGAVKKLLKRLRKGDGVRIGPNAEMVSISADADLFISPEQLAERSAATSRQRVQDWLSYSDRWSKDSDVVAYYLFERRNERTRVLKNHGPNRLKRLNGTIIGSEWLRGRWPDKEALAFTHGTDSVRFVADGDFQSLSFVAWMRIDALNNRLNGIVLTDAFDPGEIHWQITESGQVELSVRYDAGGQLPDYDFRSPPLLTSDRWGRWMLLASVYDHAASKVIHYIDGDRVSDEDMPVTQVVRIGDALIGNWDPAHKHVTSGTRERAFNGRIDELLIIARPLTADDIAEIYRNGRP
jgi:hypothetical protein